MVQKYGRALYDYKSSQKGDLSFEEDDIILIVEEDESGWWTGEHCTHGARGEFPFNYVELISEEEASRAESAKTGAAGRINGSVSGMSSQASGDKVEFSGDRAMDIRVGGSEYKSHKLYFKLDVKMESGKKKTTKKTLPEIREIEVNLRRIYPSSERVLPPSWADNAKLGSVDSDKREKTIEAYLNRLIGSATTDFLLLTWLNEKVQLHSAPEKVQEAARALSNLSGERQNPKVPVMANVEFTWKPQDDAELYMEEGQIIEVVSQDTGSPGWWQGRMVDGSRGLFPYNHVELLDSRVADSVLNGTSLGKAQTVHYNESSAPSERRSSTRKSISRISLGLLGGGKKKEKTQQPSRQRKAENNFFISSCEAFDRLLDNGFTMEEGGKLVSMTPSRDSPKEGDFVQCSYVAYVWDCQKQSIVEFAASDRDSKLAEAGPMEFFVGKGEVIKGIDYAVQRMKQGQSVRLIVTPQYAYGAVGLPPEVPPHAHVVYDLTLDAFGNEATVEMDDLPPPPPDGSRVSAEYGRHQSAAPPSFSSARKQSLSSAVRSSNKPPRPSVAKPNFGGSSSYQESYASEDSYSSPRAQTRRPSASRAQRKPSFQPQSTFSSASPSSSRGTNGGFVPPKGKNISLQDAIAMRRMKVEQQPASNIMRPVAERNKANRQTANFQGFAGRARVEVGGGSSGNGPAPSRPPQPEYSAATKAYSLKELQDAVRDKKLRQLGVDPSRIEDYLTDQEFERAFRMNREEFLLKPMWRQQALKKGARLF